MSFTDLAQQSRLVLVGILLFVIAYQFWIARLRRSEPILAMAAAWAVAALVIVTGRYVQHATLDPATVILGSKVMHTGMLALVPIGFLLLHESREAPRGRLFYVMMVATSIPVVLVWTGDLVISHRVRSFQSLAGPVLGPVSAPLGPFAVPYIAAVGGYLVYVARRGRRDLPWHRRLPLQVALLLLLPTLVNDALLYSDRLVTIELAGVGLFAHVMAISAGIFVRTSELYTDLERTVDVRTAELRVRERELSAMLAVRRTILDAIPDTVCLLNGLRVDYVNDAGAKFFGQSAGDIAGSVITDHVVESQRVTAEQRLEAIAASPRPSQPVELRFRGPGSTERVGEVAGLMLELGDGRRTLIAIRDVTEQRGLMAKLQVADRLATVGTLAAGVAHEVNNPLTAIIGNLELMKETIAAHPEILSARPETADGGLLVDECLTGTWRIARIVEDLGLFARADDEPSILEVGPVVDQALKIARVTIRHRADVTFDYGPTPLVEASAGRLAQVFLNLLLNAGQAIPDDGAKQSIHVSTATGADGRAIIEIADSGVGVDPALLPTLFDPFVTTKRPGAGTGLGLYICRGIVTTLGGEIHLRPRTPRGTIARVTLPPARRPAEMRPASPAYGLPSSSSESTSVLIVDDEDLVLRVLRRQLRAYAVTAVTSGAAAIERLEAAAYDVVLCDLVMPGCDGRDVWKQMKRLGCEGGFVLMTGGATTEALREFIERERVPCLMKPIALADLEAAIHTAVRRRRTGRAAPGLAR